MSFAAIGHVSAGSSDGTNVTTGTLNTTGADLLVAVLSCYISTTITDSKGNTWTGLTSIFQGANSYCRIFYCVPTSVGSGHTFSASGASSYATLSVSAFSGAAASPFDVENSAGGSGPQPTGSVTPSVNDALVVTGVTVWQNVGTFGPTSIDNGFTIGAYTDGVQPLGHFGGGIAYKIQTTAAAVNPSWTTSGSSTYNAAVIAVFKPPVAGNGRMFSVF